MSKEQLPLFDRIIMKMMRKEKWSSIYMKCNEQRGIYKNPLNPQHLIRDFLNDMELIKEFKEYCKMRFEMEAEGHD